MTREGCGEGKPDEPSTADFSVRYSAKVLRERNRRQRRASLWGAIMFLIAGLLIVRESVHAWRTDSMVHVGRVGRESWPPFLAGPFGLLVLLIGAWLFWDYLTRRHKE